MMAEAVLTPGPLFINDTTTDTTAKVNTIDEKSDKTTINQMPHSTDEKLIAHNNRVLNQLVPGDLVQYKRGLYSHWAVYVGNEKVIHLHTKGEGKKLSSLTFFSASLAGCAEVKIDYYWNILKNCYAYRNNSRDIDMQPFEKHVIVMRAYEKLGCDYYDLFSYNCEHFANWCRYNVPCSEQSEKVIQFGNKVTRKMRNFHEYLNNIVYKSKQNTAIEDDKFFGNRNQNQSDSI